MDSKPMGYDSLRILLQYLDANERIYLAYRAPSLRKIEKTIPLKIQYLSFGYDSFVINKTEYQFDYCRRERTPLYVQCSNAKFFPGLEKNGLEEFRNSMIPKSPFIKQQEPRFICISNIPIEASAPYDIHYRNFNGLVKILFSKRKYPISVDTFSLNERNYCQVSNDVKFKIRKLLLSGNSTVLCDQLNSIIDSSLEGVYVTNSFERISIEHFQHKLIKEAKKLFIGKFAFSHGNDPLPAYLNLQNKFIEKEGNDGRFNGYNEVINSWIGSGKPIGSTFIFHAYVMRDVLDVIDQVALDHNGAVKGKGCITVPMPSYFSQLRVSCKPKQNRHTPDDWILELKVVPLDDQVAQ